MIILKNKDLQPLMLSILGIKDNGTIVGLMTEKLSLGAKRRLQKIRNEAHKLLQELEKDRAQISQEFPVKIAKEAEQLTEDEIKLNAENIEKRKKEIDVLMNEDVKIDQEKVSMAMIEAIETSNSYDFELLEKIAE